MDDLLDQVADYVALFLNAIALLIIVMGGIDAVMSLLRVTINKSATGASLRASFIKFARWLIAALTFQLAADIVGTLIAPSWDDLGKLATVAVIRTFLTYFLDRDLDKYMKRQENRNDLEAL